MFTHYTETTADDCHILNKDISSFLTVWQFNDYLFFFYKNQQLIQSDHLNTQCFDIWSHDASYILSRELTDYLLTDRCFKMSYL